MKRLLYVGLTIVSASLSSTPRPSQAQATPPLQRPSTPDAVRPVLSPTNNFDVRSFGARSDGQTDDTSAIQRAVNAAQAAAEKEPNGGANVIFPSGRSSYLVSSPIFVDGSSVELRGEGLGTSIRPVAYYGGPMFVLGVTRLNRVKLDPKRFRKDARGVLDASANEPRPRSGLATRGEASVLIQAQSFQLGGQSPTYKGITPDYWSETRQLTIEFCLNRPAGVKWTDGSALFGLSTLLEPCPWNVRVGPTGNEVVLWFKTEDQSFQQFHMAFVPLLSARGPWRVTMQLDLDAGTFSAWVNGKRSKTTLTYGGPPKPAPLRPGMRFERHDGATPFLIGGANRCAPLNTEVVDLELYGLRVSRGLVYRMDAPTEVMTALPGPVDDRRRYFEFVNTEKVQTISLLTLDEPAGTVVKTQCLNTYGCGFWIPAKRIRPANNLVLKDMQVWSNFQQAVALGEVFGFRAENVSAGHGLQGIGSLSLSCTYPVTLRGCRLFGYDAAYFGYEQILHATDTEIAQSGRESIRFIGGCSTWDRTLITFLSPNTETFIKFLLSEYGQVHRVTDMLIDNEGGGPKRAVLECEQGKNCPTRLVVDGLDVSRVDPGAALVLLKGYGVDASFRRARLEVRNLTVFGGGTKTALRVDGPGWYGTFDASGLNEAPVAGDGLANITVIKPPEGP